LRVQGLRFRVEDLGFGEVQFMCRVEGLGVREVQWGCRGWGSGLRVGGTIHTVYESGDICPI